MAFREGALVKQGDLLFTIDPAPYQASVAQAQGQVASAEAKVSLAQTELDRGRRLSDNRTISQSDLDQRQSSLAEAQAGLRSAQAALQSAQLDLDYTEVRAPVSGRIGKIEVTAGNLVAAGSTSLRADDARFCRSDLCELQCQRRDGDARACPASADG